MKGFQIELDSSKREIWPCHTNLPCKMYLEMWSAKQCIYIYIYICMFFVLVRKYSFWKKTALCTIHCWHSYKLLTFNLAPRKQHVTLSTLQKPSVWLTHTCLHEPLLISKELCSFSLALHFGSFLTVDPRRELVGRNGVQENHSKRDRWQTQPPTKNWLRIGGVSALIHPNVHFNLIFAVLPRS